MINRQDLLAERISGVENEVKKIVQGDILGEKSASMMKTS